MTEKDEEEFKDAETGEKNTRIKNDKENARNMDRFDPHAPGPEEEKETDPDIIAQIEFIANTEATSELEKACKQVLDRKEVQIQRLVAEITKLKGFISKRKQTYKRKRKESSAPTRALSAYNIFVQDRFAKLAKDNERALKSDDTDAMLKRVPPASLVASTGHKWKDLPAEEKAKYEERAKADRKRYEEQMAQYQPPDKQSNRKRNKTGYNMFFSAHVLRLKQTEGVPSERGSVARLVGTAWKQLSADEKQYYEREADKHNGMHPLGDGDEEEEEDELTRQAERHYMAHGSPEQMHMHAGVPPPHMHAGMHQQPPQHDPRASHYAHYPPHMYQPAYGHYDYSQHHQRHPQGRAGQGGYQQQAYSQRHPYD